MKRNPRDLTVVNARASKARDGKLASEIRLLKARVRTLEKAVLALLKV